MSLAERDKDVKREGENILEGDEKMKRRNERWNEDQTKEEHGRDR